MKMTLGFLWVFALLSFSSSAAAPLASVGLTVDKGPGPLDVTLSWIGGSPPYQVFRSTLASNVTAPEKMVMETTGTGAVDTPPAGPSVYFYQIVELCPSGSCPLAEPPEPAPAEPYPGWRDERGASGPLHSTYLFSGEFYLSVEDLRIKGRGLDFIWARKYRSRNGTFTAMGQGWDFSYNVRIEVNGPNRIVHDGNSRSDLFVIQPDGTWARRELFRVLTQQQDGSYRLLFPDTGQWNFRPLDGSPAQGKIASSVDRNGNALAFSYDGAGRLTSVTDTLNRPITVQYDADGLIASITDFTGRQVLYTHYHNGDPGGSAGDLALVRTPIVVGTPHGNDFPSGKTTVYTYATATGVPLLDHNLLTITDPRGVTYLRNTYDPTTNPADPTFDHLVRQVWGDPGDTIDVVYVPLTPDAGNNFARRKAIVNDRVGNVSERSYDGRNRLVIETAFTGRAPDPDQPTTETVNRPTGQLRASDPAFFETRYEYNDDSKTTRVTAPNGTVARYVYDLDLNPGSPRRSRGNLRESHRLPGTLGGDQVELIELFEYDAGSGNCCGTNMVTRHVDGRGNETLYTYDPRGNRVHTQHRIPSIVEDFAYNAFGQMTEHTLPMKGNGYRRVDAFDYYAAGPQTGYLQASRVDANGFNLTTTYEYDAAGNVVRTVDPRGNDTLRTLNALDQIVRERSREALPGVRYETLTWYDANDNVVRTDVENRDELGVLQPDTHFSSMREYETLNRLVRSCQERTPFAVPPGALTCAVFPPSTLVSTVYTYDANRNRTLVRNPVAVSGAQIDNTIDTEYDERDLVFRTIRAKNNATSKSTTQTDYDGNGNVVRVQAGIEDAVNPHVTLYAYDGYDRRTTTTDPMGNVTTRHYDANGNVTSERVDGQLLDTIGGANVRLSEFVYQYDGMDRRIRQDVSHFDTQTQAPIGDGFSTTQWTYADSGQLVLRQDNNPGHVTTYAYDSANRLARTTDARGNTTEGVYDGESNLIAATDTDRSDLGDPDQTVTTTYAYDALDRLIARTDNLSNVEGYAYDSRSNHVRTTDARGNKTLYEYDGLSRLIRTSRDMNGNGLFTDPVDIITSQTWDDDSRLVSQTDDNINSTSYAYDALNRRIATDYADCTTDSSSYDVHDDAITTTDANGTSVQSTYDRLDRLMNRTVTVFGPGVPGPPTGTGLESYQYDGLSRLIRAQDDDSIVTRGSGATSGYDSLGNVLRETQQILGVGPGGVLKTITAQYDGEGNRTSLNYAGSRTVAYAYDSLDRVVSVSDVPFVPIADYAYRGRSLIERRGYGNNTRYEPFYDGIRRIMMTTHSLVAGPQFDQRNYGWDPNGNRMLANRLLPTPEHRMYSYDAANRITQSNITSAAPSCVTDYTLDGAGNRQSVSGCQDPGPYAMSPATCEPADRQMNQYTSTPLDSRTNDSKGNLTATLPVTRNYTYDFRDRLVQFFDSGTGQTTSYKYDAIGHRVSKTTGAAFTRFVYYGPEEIAELDSVPSTVATYVWGPGNGGVLQMIRSGQKYFYHEDDQGSVVKVTASAGNVVEGYEYRDYGKTSFFDALGNPILQSAIGNPFGYASQRLDTETGLYYGQTAYQDTRAGRSTSRDPHGIWGDAADLGNPFVGSANAVHAAVPAEPQGVAVSAAQQPVAQQAASNVAEGKPVHIEYGPDKSEYLAAGSWHAKVGAAATSYWPADLKHIVGGPRDSWFVPESYVHVAEGFDQSNWISPLVFHVAQDGPEKSHYVPKDWQHMKTGPSRSYYFPKGWNHLDDQANKSRMEYTVPGIDKPFREWELQGRGGGSKDKLVGESFRRKFLLAADLPAARIPDGFLQTNEAFLDGLRAARPSKTPRAKTASSRLRALPPPDVADARSVLAFLIDSLPSEVTVYPSENYYYFVFAADGALFKGSLSLFASTRDRGVVDLGYVEIEDAPSHLPSPAARGGFGTFGAKDGLALAKLDDFRFALDLDGEQVVFNLYQPGLVPPRKAKLLPEEIYVGPSFDESGLQFYLLYDSAQRHAYWILNEDVRVTETFSPRAHDVLIGERTGFAFYDDKERKRKILIGAKGENVLQNNWYDGPFDQMPDNYVNTGQLEVQSYLERSYPGTRARIDKYGNYLDHEGARIAVAPYLVYFSEHDVLARASACALAPSPSARYACLTEQRFDLPSGFYETASLSAP